MFWNIIVMVMFCSLTLDMCASECSENYDISQDADRQLACSAEVFPPMAYDLQDCITGLNLLRLDGGLSLENVCVSVHHGVDGAGGDKKCGGLWNISGMTTDRGVYLKDAFLFAAQTLEEGKQYSEFFDNFMTLLRESGCIGDRFVDFSCMLPLRAGIHTLNSRFIWGLRFVGHCPQDAECLQEVVRMRFAHVTVSGYLPCDEKSDPL